MAIGMMVRNCGLTQDKGTRYKAQGTRKAQGLRHKSQARSKKGRPIIFSTRSRVRSKTTLFAIMATVFLAWRFLGSWFLCLEASLCLVTCALNLYEGSSSRFS